MSRLELWAPGKTPLVPEELAPTIWGSHHQRATHDLLFNEMAELQHALRSKLGYNRARPQAVLNLLGSFWSPTQSDEA